jgi:hypothetical protein
MKAKLRARWAGMMSRCYKATSINFRYYGGRGIEVCERWRNADTFIADNLPHFQPGLFLDRTDNNGPYSPDNCRWVTREKNMRNRRNNVMLTHAGKTMTMAEWALETGLPENTIWSRKRMYGWSDERALTTPSLSAKQRCALARDNNSEWFNRGATGPRKAGDPY